MHRRVLQHAACAPAYVPDQSITATVPDCGFSSSVSFCRAFRQHYGMAPRSFRAFNRSSFNHFVHEDRCPVDFSRPADKVPERFAALAVRVEERPAYHVAYLRHRGPIGDVEGSITRTFECLSEWVADKGWPDRAGANRT